MNKPKSNELLLVIVLACLIPIIAITLLLLSANNAKKPEVFLSDVKKDNIKVVEKYYKDHPDYINKVDENGFTPLLIAVKNKKFNVAEYLIDNGADMFAKDKEGHDCLYYATLNNDKKMIGLIKYKQPRFETELINKLKFYSIIALDEDIKKIEDILNTYPQLINVKNIYGWDTPLMIAVANRRRDVVKFLVEKGADIDSENIDQATPLDRAISNGDYKIVKYLIEKGAKIKDESLRNAAHYQNRIEIIKLLISKGANVNAMYDFGTPLHTAVSYDNQRVIELLLDKGANINTYNEYKDTPLHISITHDKSLETIKFLLLRGADVNAKNALGKTPLSLADRTTKGLEISRLLVEKGAKVELENEKPPQFTCNEKEFFDAVKKGDVNFVKNVVDYYPELTIKKDEKGQGPLHIAAQNGDNEIIELLTPGYFSPSYNSFINDNNGNSPLFLAITNRHIDTAKLLIDRSYVSRRQSMFSECIKSGDIEMMKCLLDKGAKINKDIPLGKEMIYPIHYAVILNKPEVVRFLISQGADLYAKAKDGTPLHYAAMNGFNEIVKLLLDEGAYINAQNKNYLLPLDIALKFDRKETVKLLQKEGAKTYSPKK